MRGIEALRKHGDRVAAFAFDMFAYRARTHVASALTALEGCDEIVFSRSIGEDTAVVRSAVMSGMEWCGVRLDPPRNADPALSAGRISLDSSPGTVRVVAVEEEFQIARAVVAVLGSAG